MASTHKRKLFSPRKGPASLSLLAVLALLASAPHAIGQGLAARMTTLTPYGNFAREANRLAFKSLPAKTPIASPGTTVAANLNNTSAATIVGWRVRAGVASMDVSEQGTGNAGSIAGTTRSTAAINVTQGSHELLFEIAGRAGTRGLLEMWASGIAQAGSGVKMAVDVGNDNTIDFSSSASTGGSFDRFERSATIPRSGVLSIRIITTASLALRSGYAVYKTGLSVRFTPGIACDVTPYGTSCGPRLTGQTTTTGAQRTLGLELATKSPLTPGVLVIGNRRLALQIGGTRCFLLSNFVASVGFVTDAKGVASRKFAFPATLQFSLTLQDAIFPGLTSLQTSNGLEVVCK